MQLPASELPRTPFPGTWMNKGRREDKRGPKGRSVVAPALQINCEPKGLLLLLLGRPRYVLDHSTQFPPELLLAVINSVHVCARTGHALDDPAGLSDVLVSHSVQRKLRRVEGHSVRTVDSRICPECDQGLVASRECRIAQDPGESVGVLLQDGVWHFSQVVGNEPEILRELVEDLLPVSHWSHLLSPQWILCLYDATNIAKAPWFLSCVLPRRPLPGTGVKIALVAAPFSWLRGGPARAMEHLGE